jgi:hypothetical protein
MCIFPLLVSEKRTMKMLLNKLIFLHPTSQFNTNEIGICFSGFTTVFIKNLCSPASSHIEKSPSTNRHLFDFMCPQSPESVEKLAAEQILFAATIPCCAICIAGRNTADDGAAETDRVLILLSPFGRLRMSFPPVSHQL